MASKNDADDNGRKKKKLRPKCKRMVVFKCAWNNFRVLGFWCIDDNQEFIRAHLNEINAEWHFFGLNLSVLHEW